MQVERLGDSLVVRLPADAVETLQLKEGDEVEVEVAGSRSLRVTRDMTRDEAIETLRALARPAPPGFRFSRDEANARGHE
jgi:antitoxin MazE